MAICPVCGFAELGAPSWDDDLPSDEICPSCGTQFGYDDAAGGDVVRRRERWTELRGRWVDEGPSWWSTSLRSPEGWDPVVQLANLGLLES